MDNNMNNNYSSQNGYIPEVNGQENIAGAQNSNNNQTENTYNYQNGNSNSYNNSNYQYYQQNQQNYNPNMQNQQYYNPNNQTGYNYAPVQNKGAINFSSFSIFQLIALITGALLILGALILFVRKNPKNALFTIIVGALIMAASILIKNKKNDIRDNYNMLSSALNSFMSSNPIGRFLLKYDIIIMFVSVGFIAANQFLISAKLAMLSYIFSLLNTTAYYAFLIGAISSFANRKNVYLYTGLFIYSLYFLIIMLQNTFAKYGYISTATVIPVLLFSYLGSKVYEVSK